MADNKNTPKPSAKKPTPPKPTPLAEPKKVDIKIYDPVVGIDIPVSEPEEAPAKVAYTETPSSAPVVSDVPATTYAVVSNSRVDAVHASKIIPHNKMQKKSLSVHHLQRRLVEWGFTDAFLDKDGYYGDHTTRAVSAFQNKLGLAETGLPDYETLDRVFEGDTNVQLMP
jgi:hypothetical protein